MPGANRRLVTIYFTDSHSLNTELNEASFMVPQASVIGNGEWYVTVQDLIVEIQQSASHIHGMCRSEFSVFMM